jgi:hypothetical protein
MGNLSVDSGAEALQIVKERAFLPLALDSEHSLKKSRCEWQGWEKRRAYSSFGTAIPAVRLDITELTMKS